MLDPWEPCAEGPEEYDASSSNPTAGGAAEHEVVKERSLGDKISSVVTDAGRRDTGKRYWNAIVTCATCTTRWPVT